MPELSQYPQSEVSTLVSPGLVANRLLLLDRSLYAPSQPAGVRLVLKDPLTCLHARRGIGIPTVFSSLCSCPLRGHAL